MAADPSQPVTYILGADRERERIAALRNLNGLGADSPSGRIALQIVAPGEPDIDIEATRLQDGGMAQKSAITKTHAEYPSNWQLPSSGTGLAYHAVILKRQFGRFAIVNDSNPQNQPFVYTWMGSQLSQNSFAAPTGDNWVNPVGATATGLIPNNSAFQPHDVQLSAGFLDGGRNYIWVDAPVAGQSSINVISLTGTTLPSTLTVQLYQAIDDEEQFVNQVAGAGVSYISLPVLQSGYYRLKFYNSTAAAINGLTVFHAVGPAVGTGVPAVSSQAQCNNIWMHLPVPGLVEIINRVSALRFIGGSFRLMNTQADLFQNGRITGATVGDGEDWQQTLTNGTNLCNNTLYNNVSSFTNAQTRKADTGFFDWVAPNDIEDFRWQNEVQRAPNNTAGIIQFPLVDKSPYQVMVASIEISPQLGTPNTTTILRNVYEFYSTINQINNTEPPRTSFAELAAAVGAIQSVPHQLENPRHLAQIAFALSQFAPVLGNFVGDIMEGTDYGKYADFARKAGAGVGTALDKISERLSKKSKRRAQ